MSFQSYQEPSWHTRSGIANVDSGRAPVPSRQSAAGGPCEIVVPVLMTGRVPLALVYSCFVDYYVAGLTAGAVTERTGPASTSPEDLAGPFAALAWRTASVCREPGLPARAIRARPRRRHALGPARHRGRTGHCSAPAVRAGLARVRNRRHPH